MEQCRNCDYILRNLTRICLGKICPFCSHSDASCAKQITLFCRNYFHFFHRTSRHFQSAAPESGSTPRGTYPENWDLSGAVFDHGSSLLGVWYYIGKTICLKMQNNNMQNKMVAAWQPVMNVCFVSSSVVSLIGDQDGHKEGSRS